MHSYIMAIQKYRDGIFLNTSCWEAPEEEASFPIYPALWTSQKYLVPTVGNRLLNSIGLWSNPAGHFTHASECADAYILQKLYCDNVPCTNKHKLTRMKAVILFRSSIERETDEGLNNNMHADSNLYRSNVCLQRRVLNIE